MVPVHPLERVQCTLPESPQVVTTNPTTRRATTRCGSGPVGSRCYSASQASSPASWSSRSARTASTPCPPTPHSAATSVSPYHGARVVPVFAAHGVTVRQYSKAGLAPIYVATADVGRALPQPLIPARVSTRVNDGRVFRDRCPVPMGR